MDQETTQDYSIVYNGFIQPLYRGLYFINTNYYSNNINKNTTALYIDYN